MPPRSHRRPLIGLCLVIGWACLTVSWAAGAPPTGGMKEVANPLLLPQDRLHEEWLTSARKCLDSGDFSQAIVLLRRILEADEDTFSATSDLQTLVSSREQSAQLMRRLPENMRLSFQADVDRLARDAWLIAKQDGSAEAIAAFANRYRASQQGLEALRFVAADERDRAHHAQAALAWQAVLRHPLLSASQRTAGMVALFESTLLAGQLPAAEQLIRDLPAQVTTMTVGGQSVNLREWMRRRLGEVNSVAANDANGEGTAAQLPALRPTWTRDLPTVNELQRSMASVRRYYRDHGVVSSSMLRPLVVGNLILTRTMQDLVACDLQTGEQVWAVPNQEYAWLSKPPGVLDNSQFRTAKASAWHRRTEGDSVFSGMATNGKFVVVVQEPDRSFNDLSTGWPRAGAVPARGGATGVTAGENRWNRLCAYDLANRQLVWQIGGPPTGPADQYGGLTFLSVPTFVDQLMYSVARRDDELVLLAMDQTTGHLRWSVNLGVLAPHLADNFSRHRIACPVTVNDGLLLCPTAAGSLVAVSPITRSIEWAFRYPLVQHDIPVRLSNATPPVVMLPDVWWNEWREVACQPAQTSGQSKVLVLTSPDTDQLHAIDAVTGVELWRAPRNSGLHLAGVTKTAALVIEAMGVRAHDLQTGRVIWSVATGEISGRGVIAGDQFLQPKRDGGMVAIDLRSGFQSHLFTSTDAVTDSLAVCQGGWITRSDQKLSRLPVLETVRRQLQERIDLHRDDAAAVELARLDLQASDPIAARKRLVGVELTDAKAIRQEALLMLLRDKSLREKVPPADRHSFSRDELGPELLELAQSDDERLMALRTLADAASAEGDVSSAFSLYLDGLAAAETIGSRLLPYWPGDGASTRIVRSDRVLLGAIQRLFDDASRSGTSESLEKILNERLETARRGDPFAAQKLLDRLLPLEWARRAILSNETDALYARTLQKAEPVILAVAGSANRETSARGLELFANLQAQAGWRADAEIIQRRMLTRLPGALLANGETLAAALSSQPDRADAHTRLLNPPPDLWPNRMPTVEQESIPHLDVHFVPVRIQSSDASLLNGLDVAVRRDGRQLQFACAGYNGTWTKLLPEPKFLRSNFANMDQVEAHAVGHQLILRIGSEVFGVFPFNARGEPRAELSDLRLDMAPDFSQLPSESSPYPEMAPAKVGLRHEGVRLIDSFGRTFTGLSVVRANYLCYRSQAKLVVADLQSGRRLWERLDLPPNCLVLGDDDFVYLWHPDDKTMQSLSVIDGREVNQIPWTVSPDDYLMQQGGQVWSIDRQQSTTISLKNARDGSSTWSRDFAGDAIPFVMDQTTLGVVDPIGTLHLLSADTGAPLSEPLTVECPDRIERIVSLQDEHRWYVAISAPVPRLSNLLSEQLWGASRVTFVNGWLYGIERKTPGIAWRRHLDSECLPRHVSQFAPVILQLGRRPASDNPGETSLVGHMRILDKRTGHEILTRQDIALHAYSTLIPSDNFENLIIHTERQTIRLKYVTSTSDPVPERANDKE